MAKLLSTAIWPEDGKTYPDYPVEFQISHTPEVAEAQNQGWMTCHLSVLIQGQADEKRRILFESDNQILRRDLARLAADIKALVQQQQATTMTFVPITPSFELWLQHLSDEQYRAIIWQDLAHDFQGAGDIAHHGVRFTTNRARLMGFTRALESELQE